MLDKLQQNLFSFWPLICSFGLFVFSLGIFLAIDQQNFLLNLNISRAWLIYGFFTLYLLGSVLGFYLLFKTVRISQLQVITGFLQSFLILLACVVYYFRFNSSYLVIANFQWGRDIVYFSLSLLIFLVNFFLLSRQRLPFWLLFLKVVVLNLSVFSFVNFINFDRTFLRFFTYQILEHIFSLPTLTWLVLATLAVTLVSISNLEKQRQKPREKQKKEQNWLSLELSPQANFSWQEAWLNFLLSLFFALCSLQVLFLLSKLDYLTYWYKTIAFVIFWDFLYKQMQRHLRQEKTYTTLSAVYHLGLLLLVLIWQLA